MKTGLIVGVDSTIGKALEKKLIDMKWAVYGTTRRRGKLEPNHLFLDLTDTSSFHIKQQIDVVFLCAGITNISACSENKALADIINTVAPVQLAQYFISQGSHVVYLSTNAVFNGKHPKVKTTDPLDPMTWYGQCKANTERELSQISKNIAIVRMTKVLTKRYPLFLTWITALKNDISITPFHDLSFCPISIEMVVHCLEKIGSNSLSGVFHLSGEEDVSYLEAAYWLADYMHAKRHLITPKSVFESGATPDAVPKFTSLDMPAFQNDLWTPTMSFNQTMQTLNFDV